MKRSEWIKSAKARVTTWIERADGSEAEEVSAADGPVTHKIAVQNGIRMSRNFVVHGHLPDGTGICEFGSVEEHSWSEDCNNVPGRASRTKECGIIQNSSGESPVQCSKLEWVDVWSGSMKSTNSGGLPIEIPFKIK